jgi:membrane protein DedA with SNARE-associated domain
VNFSDYVLSTLGVYGLPVLFGTLLIGSIGLPLPSSLLLLVAGSFVAQGDMSLWPVLALAAAGAILGDNVGYALGRWGGRRMQGRISRLIGGEERLKTAEKWLRKREGASVFLSRWLLTPLGPIINITSGLTGYSWPRFLFYDVLGEALWVTLYVLLGKFFSDRVQEMSEFLGDFTWMIVGLLLVALFGWKLFQYLRPSSQLKPKAKTHDHLVDETP